jgi:hypothetical protein
MTVGESEEAEDGRSDANNKIIIIIGTQIPQAKGKTWLGHETMLRRGMQIITQQGCCHAEY